MKGFVKVRRLKVVCSGSVEIYIFSFTACCDESSSRHRQHKNAYMKISHSNLANDKRAKQYMKDYHRRLDRVLKERGRLRERTRQKNKERKTRSFNGIIYLYRRHR